MARLGSEKRPVFLRVQTEARLREVVERCAEAGAHYVAGLEPDKPEDISDLERLLNPPTVTHRTRRVGRNEPCPCGSGKKFKKCCTLLEAARS